MKPIYNQNYTTPENSLTTEPVVIRPSNQTKYNNGDVYYASIPDSISDPITTLSHNSILLYPNNTGNVSITSPDNSIDIDTQTTPNTLLLSVNPSIIPQPNVVTALNISNNFAFTNTGDSPSWSVPTVPGKFYFINFNITCTTTGSPPTLATLNDGTNTILPLVVGNDDIIDTDVSFLVLPTQNIAGNFSTWMQIFPGGIYGSTYCILRMSRVIIATSTTLAGNFYVNSARSYLGSFTFNGSIYLTG
jgi:hypothetical protein